MLGGKRPGAGRPKKKPGEKHLSVTVMLSPELAAIAKIMGGGGTTKNVNLPAVRRGILRALKGPILMGPNE